MQSRSYEDGVVLGIDIGDARIGIARAHSIAQLAEPLAVVKRNENDDISHIQTIIKENNIVKVIIGLPRLASGDDSEQTIKVRDYTEALLTGLDLPYEFVDESYTSQEADEYIAHSGKVFSSNDAVAACIILERYFADKRQRNV